MQGIKPSVHILSRPTEADFSLRAEAHCQGGEWSEAKRRKPEALMVSASGVGWRVDGRRGLRQVNMEEVITTKRGSFGFIRVTVPMHVKEKMLGWCNRSSMKKSEFFRVALMIGVKQLAESINAKNPIENYEPIEKDI